MGIFFLFVSNVEYIGLLVVLIALISDAQIQTIRRNWGIAGTLLLLFTLMSYDIKNATPTVPSRRWRQSIWRSRWHTTSI